MGRRRNTRQPRVVEVDADRFSGGIRRLNERPLISPDLVGPGTVVQPGRPIDPGILVPPGTVVPDIDDFAPNPPPEPDVRVDVVRSRDLVSFTVEGFEVELVSGPNPVLRAQGRSRAVLVFEFPWQHLGERAIYEEAAQVPNPLEPGAGPTVDPLPVDAETDHVAPIQARPSKPSRLAFNLPEGIEIPFSTKGLLEAMGELEMAVHPFARPRPRRITVPDLAPLPLLGGVLARLSSSGGVTLSRAPRGFNGPNPRTAAGAAELARNLRIVRTALASEAGETVRIDEAPAASRSASPSASAAGRAIFEAPRIIGESGLSDALTTITSRPRTEQFSRPPTALETSIEAPFRLTISPSNRNGWAHAINPVGAEDNPDRVELWHTRMGVRRDSGDEVSIDERQNAQRIIRAIWTRDREALGNWRQLFRPTPNTSPFRMSLDSADRHMLVRQSAETWRGADNELISPSPVDADRLYLSSLGAWLDLHGEWDTDPYSAASMSSILLWDHVAPQGRDQYVRVVYPGYLYPLGLKCTLVKVTERKMKSVAPSTAGLFQRMFLVVGEPMKRYSTNDFPLSEVRIAPLVTPTLSPPPSGVDQARFFVPRVDNNRFNWTLHAKDKEGQPVKLETPLVWVADAFPDFGAVDSFYAGDPASTIAVNGQDVAFTDPLQSGDTTMATTSFKFSGAAALGTSQPAMAQAQVTMKAVEQLSAAGLTDISYASTFVANGFDAGANAGEVWAEVVGAPKMLDFGGGEGAAADKGGGFVAPSMPIRGISRTMGTVGDVASVEQGTFDATAYLDGALPRLFGIVDLLDLFNLDADDLGNAPNVVSEALGRVEQFLADLERARQAVEDAVAEAQKLVDRAASKVQEVQDRANAALTAATDLRDSVVAAVDAIFDLVANIGDEPSLEDVLDAFEAPLDALQEVVDDIEAVAELLPPLIKNVLLSLATALQDILNAADIVEDIFRFLNGIVSNGAQLAFRFEWKPPMASWPAAPNTILELEEDSLVLAISGRAGTNGDIGVDVLAELRDFALVLLPGEPLVRFAFEHISFKGGSSGKMEVDVVMGDIEFLGLLGFIEVIKDLIPLDGFSDPPYLDVDASGVEAGFSLELPNVAIGVFALSNMTLGADVQVPFLGEAVTVGFNFCTRERPFTVQVSFIGGGGWFLIRLAPDGLQLMELGVEAGASLSVNFGVASGSVSAMIGVYMRLEGDGGSLTGYFRLRGSVSVLGLITASIELYLALTYDFGTGKLFGEAKITVKVEVFVFSASVTIRAERQFAGSNGDPTFAELMVADDGTAPAWSDYCMAFGAA